jgi:plastocyanin
MARRAMRGFVPLAAMALLAACSSNSGGSSTGATSTGGATTGGSSASPSEGGGKTITLDGQPANDHGSQDVSGKSDISLELDNEGNEYYFSPTVLKGTAGQQVTIELENQGDTEHNFTLSDQGVNQNVDPGKKVEVTVTFPNSGTLVFACAFHAALGMRGALEVA